MDYFTLTRYFCVCNWMCIKTGAAVNSGAGKATYMNNSGQAVVEAMNFYKIPPENVIVIFDDISLDVGKMRG